MTESNPRSTVIMPVLRYPRFDAAMTATRVILQHRTFVESLLPPAPPQHDACERLLDVVHRGFRVHNPLRPRSVTALRSEMSFSGVYACPKHGPTHTLR